MQNKGKIIQIIFRAIDEINSALLKTNKLEKKPQTILVGQRGKLDSLGIISFITTVEQKIENEFGTIVNLANEKAMSQGESPFETVDRLADYICLILEENKNEE